MPQLKSKPAMLTPANCTAARALPRLRAIVEEATSFENMMRKVGRA